MKQRVLTALVMIPPVLLALTSTQLWPIGLLALTLLATGLIELRGMIGSALTLLGLWYLVPCLLAADPTSGVSFANAATVCGIVSFVVGVPAAYFSSNSAKGRFNWISLFAAGWIIGPLESLLALHRIGIHVDSNWNFATPVLLATVPLWAGDTAAIFAGKAFGKHLLAPSISPKKTWEGSIANFLACIAMAVPLARTIGYSPAVGLICGVAAGILGQAGDLFESQVKRLAGVKDSGNLLPGHGGILDRIDSILFTAPAIALILILANRG